MDELVNRLVNDVRLRAGLLPPDQRTDVLRRVARGLQSLADESRTPSGFLRATKILEQAMEETKENTQ